MGKKKEESYLGSIIDSDIELFEETVEGMNIGVLTGLRNTLAVTYNDLVARKNFIFENQDLDAEEKENVIASIFMELFKIEEKVVYLDKKMEELKITAFDRKSSN